MKYINKIPNSSRLSRDQIPNQARFYRVFSLEFGVWSLGFILLMGCWACKQGQKAEEAHASQVVVKQPDTLPVSRSLYQSPTFLSDATGKTVEITADATSYDEQFGDSYRVLRVLAEVNGTEKEISRRLLPVNHSPDFRYNFADVYAENKQEWVIIQGNYFFFVYDVVNDKLSKKIFPPKPKDYEAIDAQSGRIVTLAFEDNRLKGTAQDIGPFQFTIPDLRKSMR